MFFFTRRRERALPRAAFFGCATIGPLLRRRWSALAGDAHPSRALARARVGLRPLAPHREPPAVTEAAIGADLREALDVLRAIAAKIALDLAGLHRLAKLHDLVVGQILDVGVGIDADVGDDLPRRRVADPVDVGQTHLDPLVDGDVYACYPCHAPSVTPAAACGAGS